MKWYLLVGAALVILAIAGYITNFISIDLAGFLIFVTALGTLVYSQKSKVKLEGIIIIRRTKKGRDKIDKIAKAYPRFWPKVAIIGVAVGIAFMIFGSFFIASGAYNIASGQGPESGAKIVLPGPVSKPLDMPGVLVVQWWIWVIAIAVVVIPHELFHGIMCRLDNVKIKSVGWALLAILPAAFVEPDEEQLKKAKRSTRMKVYAAGSFANFLIAFIIVTILTVMSSAFFEPVGLLVNNVEAGPANLSGLHGSITYIDNYTIRDIDGLRFALSNYKPGDSVDVITVENNYFIPYYSLPNIFVPQPAVVSDFNETKTYKITLSEHPEQKGKAYMGIVGAATVYSLGADITLYFFIAQLLTWVYIFSIGIGIVNMLPIKPLDGGLLFGEIAGHFSKNEKIIVKSVSIVMAFLLLFNILGPLVIT